MQTPSTVDYERVASAIRFIKENFTAQPELAEIAAHVHLSPFHFQRMFTEWAGVSPKKFLQFLTVGYAKELLRSKATLSDTAFSTGLSGTSRLHDLFIQVEGMTPGEFKNGGETLAINYSFEETQFGNIIVASTAKGVCYLAFAEDATSAVAELLAQFPKATRINPSRMDFSRMRWLFFRMTGASSTKSNFI